MRRMSAMVYGIGGPSLAGKADIATLFAIRYLQELVIPGKVRRMPYYDGTDSVRRQLWNTTDRQKHPALFKMHEDRAVWTPEQWMENARTQPELWVTRQHAEEEAVWTLGVMNKLGSNIEKGQTSIYEGIGVLPQHMAQLEVAHSAVFVTNSVCTDLHRENVMRERRDLPNHYMRDWSEAKIDAYLTHIMPAYAKALKRLATHYGYPYFDISQGDYTEQHQRAADALFEQKPRGGVEAEQSERAQVHDMGKTDRTQRPGHRGRGMAR